MSFSLDQAPAVMINLPALNESTVRVAVVPRMPQSLMVGPYHLVLDCILACFFFAESGSADPA